MRKGRSYTKYYSKDRKANALFAFCTLMLFCYLLSMMPRTFFYGGLGVVLVIISAFLLGKGYFKYKIDTYKRNKYLSSTIGKIDNMTGEEFECYLKAIFENKGYKVELTPKTNDYGADLILRKNNITSIVQAKRYKGKVSNSAVQEIIAAQAYYGACSCMVVTNSYFTENAKVLAKANNVELWDRIRLSNGGY